MARIERGPEVGDARTPEEVKGQAKEAQRRAGERGYRSEDSSGGKEVDLTEELQEEVAEGGFEEGLNGD